jgi:hypothetical protein
MWLLLPTKSGKTLTIGYLRYSKVLRGKRKSSRQPRNLDFTTRALSAPGYDVECKSLIKTSNQESGKSTINRLLLSNRFLISIAETTEEANTANQTIRKGILRRIR